MDDPKPPQERRPGFFARYFAALDGPEPLSALDLVADESEFALLFAVHADERCRQFVGGREELRAFTAAGNMDGWAHHILRSALVGDVELVLGETRWDDGRHIGTFVCAAQLDASGRMVKYLTGRTPGLEFDAARAA